MGDIIQVAITNNYITTLTELHDNFVDYKLVVLSLDLHNRILLAGFEQFG